jgi:ATP-dependent Zn protease
MFGRFRLAIVLAILAVFGLALVWTYLEDSNRPPSYPYSALLAEARAGRVQSITQSGLELTVQLADVAEPRTVLVASGSINVYDEVCAATGTEPGPDCPVQFEVVGESQTGQWVGLLVTSLLPVLLIGGFIFFMMRAAQKKQP